MSETPAFVCSHVFANTRPVLYVSTEDGDWQFLCGEDHEGTEIPQVVGLQHLLERDSTLCVLMNLEANWEAERAHPSAPWTRRRATGPQRESPQKGTRGQG